MTISKNLSNGIRRYQERGELWQRGKLSVQLVGFMML